ncbi:MAG: XRE family transcriptional regulator [Betaproteobacteria bacterium]|nr:XRE family transcriptional regulator [Betaproteobacteria bacterium]
MSDTTGHDPQVPDGIDGAQLKRLRLLAGLDPTVLAIRTSLSKDQVLQIENGGHDLFYNLSIKRACARKLAQALGIDPNVVVADLPASAAASAVAEVALLPKWKAADPMDRKRRRFPVFAASAAVVLVMMAVAVTQLQRMDGGISAAAQLWRDWVAWMPRLNLSRTPSQASDNGSTATPSEPVSADKGPEHARSVQTQVTASANPTAPKAPSECPLANGQSPVVQPLKAFKAGQMVFVQALGDQHLCLRDHSGQAWSVFFKAGQERSFYGLPPWTVQSPALSQFKVFFQGWRLRFPEDSLNSVRIVEVPY